MMYLVLVYPKISTDDYDFIQRYRKAHDPKYFSVVKPHFTIVFATSNIVEKVFVDEIKEQSKGIRKFDFEIKCATLNQDDSGDYYHEFLVPDRGYSNIVKLHDKLYSGKLYGNLRFDIDFIPHIGIGNSEDGKACKKRIDALNSNDLEIKGLVDVLDIVAYENNRITTIERVQLS